MIVLSVLNNGPQHGYGLAREIERLSGQALAFKEGTLYPALHALENDGMIAGDWQVSESGPPRKIYTITTKGLAELERRSRLWKDFSAVLDRVMKGEPDEQTA